ncbi:MAG: AI-2E family transporter [Myxococcaceae bacterium]
MTPTRPLVPRAPPPTLGQKVVRTGFVGFVICTVLALLYFLRFLITPTALALVGFYVLKPLVNWLENRGTPRWAGVLLCLGLFITSVVGLVALLWPSLRDWLSLQAGPSSGPNVFELQLGQRLTEWEASGRRAYPNVDWAAVMTEARKLLDTQRRQLTETLPLIAVSLVSNATTFVLAPIIMVFLLLDGERMYRTAVSFIPNRFFETTLLLSHRVDQQISGYLRGAASESAMVTVLLAGLLYAVGMPNALVFASLYGVANVIPLLGPVIGLCAGLLYSLMDPVAPSIPVLLGCYGFVYLLDAMFINPMVIGKNLNLHPLTVILGVSAGGALGGVVGMLASIPFIAMAKAVAATLWNAYRRGQLQV